jgi:hypothetical protein
VIFHTLSTNREYIRKVRLSVSRIRSHSRIAGLSSNSLCISDVKEGLGFQVLGHYINHPLKAVCVHLRAYKIYKGDKSGTQRRAYARLVIMRLVEVVHNLPSGRDNLHCTRAVRVTTQRHRMVLERQIDILARD